MDIHNLDELKQAVDLLRAEMQSTLKNEVKDKIVKTQQKHIDDDVYNAYTPKRYIRSQELKNEENIVDISYNPNIIEVKNVTAQSDIYGEDKYIPEVIETGIGYDFKKYDYEYNQPRPFIENTIEELEGNNAINEVFKSSLKAKGINLE